MYVKKSSNERSIWVCFARPENEKKCVIVWRDATGLAALLFDFEQRGKCKIRRKNDG